MTRAADILTKAMTPERLNELLAEAKRAAVSIWLVHKFNTVRSVEQFYLNCRSRLNGRFVSLYYPDGVRMEISLLDFNVLPNWYNKHRIFEREEDARVYHELPDHAIALGEAQS